MRDYRIGRLNGRFVVTWEQDGRRRRFRLAAATARQAEAEARDVILAATASPDGVTVAEIWEWFRAEREGRPVATNMHHTGKSVLPHFGALRPDQITTEDCRAYIADRRAAGLKDGTIWSHLGHLRTALNRAAKEGKIARAPHIERPSQPAPKERYLTAKEVDRLLSARCEPHVKMAVRLMLSTAARVSAVLQLTWDRVDMERGLVNLRSPDATTRKGRAVVPVNDTLRAALVVAREAALSDHVVEYAGGPVGSIKKGFASLARNARLKGVTPHVLRHTAAVHMAEAGVPMEVISQYLGHSNARITAQVYARYSPEYMREAAKILDFGGLRLVQ
jgi:integrase